jgi:uncharacterized membrane protein
MSNLELISLIAMSTLYCIAGVAHFIVPKGFIQITPPWVPAPEKVNIMVGIIEIVLGVLLLFDATRTYAAIVLVIFLIAVFPANVHHYQLMRKKGKGVVVTLIRLPLQLLLIYWAYTFI